jgi:hypothetical protein
MLHEGALLHVTACHLRLDTLSQSTRPATGLAAVNDAPYCLGTILAASLLPRVAFWSGFSVHTLLASLSQTRVFEGVSSSFMLCLIS